MQSDSKAETLWDWERQSGIGAADRRSVTTDGGPQAGQSFPCCDGGTASLYARSYERCAVGFGTGGSWSRVRYHMADGRLDSFRRGRPRSHLR